MAFIIDHSSNQNAIPVIVPNYTALNFINPNYNNQVLIPVRFGLNPAVVAQIELERSISLQQVRFLIYLILKP